MVEEISSAPIQVIGNVYPAQSPVGDAVQFDGYSSEIISGLVPALDQATNLSVASWIRLDAYPWNRVPVLDQFDEHSRFFLGIDAEGHLIASSGRELRFCRSAAALPLRRWILITLSIENDQPAFSLNGAILPCEWEPTEATSNVPPAAENLLIGHVRSPLLPAPAGKIHPDFPVEYSIDGALGELVVFSHSLSDADVERLFARANRALLKPEPWPTFPRWPGGPGRFGAFYASLAFDSAWDKPRRVAPDSDVVVRFDHAPIQLVFWQGNNYVPAWVTENNRWYTDEFMETYGRPRCPYGEDCEPMSDKQERYSHVQILESTPARAVIHWRYALSEVERYAIADAASPISWGDWADEYWTVYPDGIAVRRSVLWSTAAQRDQTEFQESIVLIPPGETPEDNIHFDALTFSNLQGQTKTYSWQQKTSQVLGFPRGPAKFDAPQDAVIQWVNLKSDWKPFEVAWGEPVSFTAYNSEMSMSSFEWWNHWPVAQIASSGRPALAPDRAGHSSVSHIYWPPYEQDDQTYTKILLTGLTTLSAADLAPVAASWRNPPALELSDGRRIPYDPAQRAYVFPKGLTSPTRITLRADREHPVYHVAFVVPGWRLPASVHILAGADRTMQTRVGQVDRLDGSRLVIYLPLIASAPIKMELRKN